MTQSLMCSGFPRNRLTNSALAPSVSDPLEPYSTAPPVALAHVSMCNRAAPPRVWILKSGCDVQLAPTNPPTGDSSLGATPNPHVPMV